MSDTPLRFRHGTTLAADGTELDWSRAGIVGRDPIVLVGGPGTPRALWTGIVADLADAHELTTWDHRGFFRSGLAGSGGMTADTHADDLLRVLDDAEIERAVFVCWSFGFQIALHALSLDPGRCAGLVSICGASASTAIASGSTASLPARLASGLLRNATGVRFALEAARHQRAALTAGRLTRLLAPTTVPERVRALLDRLADVDEGRFVEAIAELGRDPLIVPSLRVPSLAISGRRDPIGGTRAAELLEEAGAPVEHQRIALATHFLPAEFPSFVALRLDAFLRQHFPAGWSRKSVGPASDAKD